MHLLLSFMETKDFIIRDVKLSDFDDIANMVFDRDNVVGINVADPVLGVDLADKELTKSYFFEKFSEVYKQVLNGNAIAAVAESDGKLVAFAHVMGGKWPGAPYIGELRRPIILKQYQDQLAGIQLIGYIKDKAKGKFEILYMMVSVDDSNILSKLEGTSTKNLGFIRWGLAPKFYKREGEYMPLVFLYCQV